MTAIKFFELRSGKTWGIMSGDGSGMADVSDDNVLIPVNQLEGLSPQEVFDTVHALVSEAEFYGLVDKLSNGVEYTKQGPTDYIESIVQTWQKFKGRDTDIDADCQILEAELRRRKAIKPKAKPQPALPGFIYLMECAGRYKIGLSKNPQHRLAQLGTQSPFDIALICTIPTNDMAKLEKKLHLAFSSKRIRGEWFELDNQDVEYIKGLAQ